MKIKLILIVSLLCLLFSCAKKADTTDTAKMIIVYYSLTGNTEFVAEQIHFITGAELFKLEVMEPYNVEFYEMIDRAREEMEAEEYPELACKVADLESYDIIFLGSPNWFGTLSNPMYSFIYSHDLAGKTIIPFITHGTSGITNTITDLKTLCPEANILDEFSVFRDEVQNSKEDIAAWLKRVIDKG